MASSLTKLQKRVQSLQARNRNQQQRRKVAELRDTAVGTGAAYVFGAIESRTGGLPTLAGIDPKLTWGAILLVGGHLVRGTPGEVLHSSADGLLAAYGYQEGRGEGYGSAIP